MAQTITPVVHGGRRGRWAGILGLHTLGATASAALLGAALGAAGAALGAPWGLPGTIVVVAVAGAYALRELAGLPVPVPELRRQVPEWWRSAFSPGTSAFLYGAGLGVGFATHLRHGTLAAVVAAAAASSDPVPAAVAVGAFGLARSGAVGAAWLAAVGRDVGGLTEALERLSVRPAVRALNGLALGAVAVLGAAQAASGPTPGGPPGGGAAAVVALVFGIAAASKAARWPAWRRTLGAYRLPAPVEGAVAVAVPLAEATVAVAILAGAAATGAGLAVVLLVAFSVAVIRASRGGARRLPCGCFGGDGTRSAGATLARNLAIGVVALAAATAGRPPVPPFGPGDAFPALLALVGAWLTGAILVRAGRLLGPQ